MDLTSTYKYILLKIIQYKCIIYIYRYFQTYSINLTKSNTIYVEILKVINYLSYFQMILLNAYVAKTLLKVIQVPGLRYFYFLCPLSTLF